MPSWRRDGRQCEAMLECESQCIGAAFGKIRVSYPNRKQFDQWLCSYHQAKHRKGGARLKLVYRWTKRGIYEP